MWVCATSTAGTRSVTGTNAAPLDAAAFVDLKTPPVVPIYMVLPLVSDGSTATLSTRPPAGPVAVLLRLCGASGDHGTFSAAVPVVLCAITVAAAIPSSNSRPSGSKHRTSKSSTPKHRLAATHSCALRLALLSGPVLLHDPGEVGPFLSSASRGAGESSVDYPLQKKGIMAVTETVTLPNGDDVSHLWATQGTTSFEADRSNRSHERKLVMSITLSKSHGEVYQLPKTPPKHEQTFKTP